MTTSSPATPEQIRAWNTRCVCGFTLGDHRDSDGACPQTGRPIKQWSPAKTFTSITALEALRQKIRDLRALNAEMKNANKHLYPIGSFVRVNDPRYDGHGMVVTHGAGTVLDQTCVMLENRMPHWYDTDRITPEHDLAKVPARIRLLKIEMLQPKRRVCSGRIPEHVIPKLP